MRSSIVALLCASTIVLGTLSCTQSGDTEGAWEGRVDTLSNGQVRVVNAGPGLWPADAAWTGVEDLRIGSLDADGPQSFGGIMDFAVDGRRRIWVLDGLGKEIRVFDSSGDYVETIGREFRFALARYDGELTPLDTFDVPTDPGERATWRIVSGGRTRASAGVPFQGRLTWQLTRRATIWALVTDQYRMFETTLEGDTIRTLTKAFEPVPVTEEERAEVLDGLESFVERGGRIDPSQIPDQQPAVGGFFADDRDCLWVSRVTRDDESPAFDVFDPTGVFLGVVEMPFDLHLMPTPLVLDGAVYGVTSDDLGVEYLVRGTIRRPGGGG